MFFAIPDKEKKVNCMKIYNLDKLNELSGGDMEFAQAIAMTFIEETPEDVVQLSNGIKAHDFTATYQAAHKIKPNLDLFGVANAHADILKIEILARENASFDEIEPLFERSKQVIDQLVEELKADFGL